MRTKEEILGNYDKIEFFMNCSLSFKFFCEKFLNIKEYGGIHDFQEEWFNAINKYDRVVIEAPSGFSKTEIIGVIYPLWVMWHYKNKSILLISKTINQAEGNLLNRIKDYIDDNEFLKELIPEGNDKTWNKREIKTKNGINIKNVPYNINIKGYRADLIICDEADSYEEIGIYFDHVASRPNPGGKICLISTPEGPTKLIQELKARKPKGYKFIKTIAFKDKDGNPWLDAEGNPKDNLEESRSIWPERFSTEELLLKREEMGENEFQKNFLCNIMTEASDAIFSLKSWVACYDESISFNFTVVPQAQYFIGADFAISKGPRADFDAYVVVEKLGDFITIKHMEVFKGTTRPQKVNRLIELYNIFQSQRTTKIIADESNMGSMVISDLRNAGITVQPQAFYSIERKKLLQTLSNVIEGKGLIVPRNQRDVETIKMTNLLLEQMLGFVRKKSDVTAIEQMQSRATHDDLVMSLAMAVKGAAKMREMSCMGVSTLNPINRDTKIN